MTEALCKAVEIWVDLALPIPGSGKSSKTTSKIAHLEHIEARTGKQLIPIIDIPVAGEHLWEWYWKISDGRGSNGFGPNPLSFQDISAWASLMGVCLNPWEVEALKKMDNAFLKVCNERDRQDA